MTFSLVRKHPSSPGDVSRSDPRHLMIMSQKNWLRTNLWNEVKSNVSFSCNYRPSSGFCICVHPERTNTPCRVYFSLWRGNMFSSDLYLWNWKCFKMFLYLSLSFLFFSDASSLLGTHLCWTGHSSCVCLKLFQCQTGGVVWSPSPLVHRGEWIKHQLVFWVVIQLRFLEKKMWDVEQDFILFRWDSVFLCVWTH